MLGFNKGGTRSLDHGPYEESPPVLINVLLLLLLAGRGCATREWDLTSVGCRLAG